MEVLNKIPEEGLGEALEDLKALLEFYEYIPPESFPKEHIIYEGFMVGEVVSRRELRIQDE